MERTLNDHLEKVEGLEDQVSQDIDDIIKSIDIDLLIDNPESIVIRIADIIKEVLVEKYIPEAFGLGVDLSKVMKNVKGDNKKDTEVPEV